MVKKKQEVTMNYNEAYKFVEGLSEDQLVEAFSAALGLLTEEELDELLLRCADIIEAVESRMAAKA